MTKNDGLNRPKFLSSLCSVTTCPRYASSLTSPVPRRAGDSQGGERAERASRLARVLRSGGAAANRAGGRRGVPYLAREGETATATATPMIYAGLRIE